MNCDKNCRGYREHILNLIENDRKSWWQTLFTMSKNISDWKKTFVNPSECPVKIGIGASKCVYIFKNKVVVAVQYDNNVKYLQKNQEEKFKRLRKIKNIQAYLNYPGETYVQPIGKNLSEGYLISHLPYCDGDLFDILLKDEAPTSSVKDLFYILRVLHIKEIYICDIKPENIFSCGGKLTFGDLDSYVYKPNKHVSITATEGYNPVRFDEMTRSSLNLEYSDMYSLCLVLCICYEKNHPEISQDAMEIFGHTEKLAVNSIKTIRRLKITWNTTDDFIDAAKNLINAYGDYSVEDRTTTTITVNLQLFRNRLKETKNNLYGLLRCKRLKF